MVQSHFKASLECCWCVLFEMEQKKRQSILVVAGSNKKNKKVHFDLVEEQSLQDVQRLTPETLPDTMIPLGENLFLTVNTFRSQTRVHIRIYTEDVQGNLHPTKEGVSLKPEVWSAFIHKLSSIRYVHEDPDAVFVIKKDICLFNHTVNYDVCISLQRMFQRKDGTFQMVPERIVLRTEHIRKLCDYEGRVFQSVKNKLLTYTLREQIVLELGGREGKIDYYCDADDLSYRLELYDALCKCLKDVLSTHIVLLVKKNCSECKTGFVLLEEHVCMKGDKQEMFNVHFENALYAIDWRGLAIDFVNQNIHRAYFIQTVEDFLACIDTNALFKTVEHLYVNDYMNTF